MVVGSTPIPTEICFFCRNRYVSLISKLKLIDISSGVGWVSGWVVVPPPPTNKKNYFFISLIVMYLCFKKVCNMTRSINRNILVGKGDKEGHLSSIK